MVPGYRYSSVPRMLPNYSAELRTHGERLGVVVSCVKEGGFVLALVIRATKRMISDVVI